MGYSLFEGSQTTEKFKENRVKSNSHSTELNHGHHPSTATPWDAYDSTPGSRAKKSGISVRSITGPAGWDAAGEAVMNSNMAYQASVCGPSAGGDCGAGGGDGGGAAMESTGYNAFRECLDGLALSYPNSDAIVEIQKMFDGMRDSDSHDMKQLYHSADGMSVRHDDGQDVIAQLAAACEATLNAFKKQTGMDYTDFRKHAMDS